MKLLQLKIDGFGKFNNQVFDVYSDNQLFFGENEAGKSTIYQFIRTILFGFPKKREIIRDFTPVNGAIYGGKVVFEDKIYGKVTVERFKEKNKGQALVTLENGQSGNDLFLEKVLAPLTKESFDQVFSFQQEQLADLTQLNEVRLQHLLLTVGLTGSERLTKMNDTFMKERQKLFKPSGRVPEINQKLRQLKKIEQQIELVESQEATYQEKNTRMSTLTSLVETAEKEKNYQSELEKTILEQQKRFPMYIEWESLSREFSESDNEAVSKIEEIKQEVRNYRFLLDKEKELLESQGEQLETQSPAYHFYIENQQIFDELLDDQLAVESMTERRQLLEEQLLDYQESKETLYKKYRLSKEIVAIDLSDDIEDEMMILAKEEEELIREKVVLSNEKSRLIIRQKDMNYALTTAENQLSTKVGDPAKSGNKKGIDPLTQRMFSGLSIAVALLFLIMAVALGKSWLYFPVVILLCVGVFGFLTIGKKKNSVTTSEEVREDYLLQLSESDEVEHSLHELENKLVGIETRLASLQTKKQNWSELYGFSMKETMTLWLSRIPIYLQLQTIQEKETEMTENLAEIDRVLGSYSDLLAFSKQWIPLENRTTKESFQAMKQFVDEQKTYLNEKALSSNTQQNFQSQLNSLRKKITESKRAVLSLIDLPQVTSIDEAMFWIKKQEMSKVSQSRKEDLGLSIESYFDLSKKYKLVEINQHLIRIKNKEDELSETISLYQDEFQTLKYELSQMEKNGSLDILYQQRENQLSVIRDLSDQWISYKIAEELTQDVFQYLSDQQLPALLATVTSYFKILTDGAYIKVLVTNGQLYVRDKEQKRWSIIQLSTGTKDQLYMAFRLAFVHLHTEDYNTPVMIDDGWLHFDTKRKLTLFRLLSGFSKHTQVICLSSDQAVKAYFEAHDLSIVTIGRDGSV